MENLLLYWEEVHEMGICTLLFHCIRMELGFGIDGDFWNENENEK